MDDPQQVNVINDVCPIGNSQFLISDMKVPNGHTGAFAYTMDKFPEVFEAPWWDVANIPG